MADPPKKYGLDTIQRSESVAYQSTQMTPEEIHDLWKTFKKDQSDESLRNKLIEIKAWALNWFNNQLALGVCDGDVLR